jgi:hypothetical protein
MAEPAHIGQSKTPADFLKSIKGKPVVVKLNSGVDYRGKPARVIHYLFDRIPCRSIDWSPLPGVNQAIKEKLLDEASKISPRTSELCLLTVHSPWPCLNLDRKRGTHQGALLLMKWTSTAIHGVSLTCHVPLVRLVADQLPGDLKRSRLTSQELIHELLGQLLQNLRCTIFFGTQSLQGFNLCSFRLHAEHLAEMTTRLLS